MMATVLPSAVKRAARLAEALTSDPLATEGGEVAWSVQDVIDLAVVRGLELLEQRYPDKARA